MTPAEEVHFILNFENPSGEDHIFLVWRLSKIENVNQYLIGYDKAELVGDIPTISPSIFNEA